MIHVINFPDATGGVFFSQIFEDTGKNIDSLYMIKPLLKEYMSASVKTDRGYDYYRRTYDEAREAYVEDVINDIKTYKASIIITAMDYNMTKKLIEAKIDNCKVINFIPSGGPKSSAGVTELFIDKIIRAGIIEISDIPDFIPSVPSGINAARVELISEQIKLIRDIDMDSSMTNFAYVVYPSDPFRKITIENVEFWVDYSCQVTNTQTLKSLADE